MKTKKRLIEKFQFSSLNQLDQSRSMTPSFGGRKKKGFKDYFTKDAFFQKAVLVVNKRNVMQIQNIH